MQPSGTVERPDQHGNDPWTDALRRGDFEAAWKVSDRVLRERAGTSCWHLPRHLQYAWDGNPVSGKTVLVRCYHGLGDTIQFIRYVPMLARLAAQVIVWAQPALVDLLKDFPGARQVLPLHDGSPDVLYETDIEIMELPYLFRSTLATLPAEVPYLKVAPSRLVDARRAGKLAVGLIWEAGAWDPRRTVPLESLMASLRQVSGVELHALQRGRGLDDWRLADGPVSGSDAVTEAAQTMQRMDLIISVDSFPAHLAGALGRPVWTLLHSDPDWRWLADREDSPWYPTMRLFRQSEPGEWQPVIDRLTYKLRDLVARKARCSGSDSVPARAGSRTA